MPVTALAAVPLPTQRQGPLPHPETASAGRRQAVIVTPGDGSVVAADDLLNMTVAAGASASLKAVTIRLDDMVVQTLSFAESEAVTITQRTVNLYRRGRCTHAGSAGHRLGRGDADQTLPGVIYGGPRSAHRHHRRQCTD